MSGIEGWPETCRALGYNYFAGTWTSIAVQLNGEVMVATGESIATLPNYNLVGGNSGGYPLGSGLSTSGMVVQRVIVNVPMQTGSGALAVGGYSGEAMIGCYLAGKSGHAPFPGEGIISSGKGLWVPTGGQKELYVQSVDEIYVCTDSATSGLPITWIAEGVNV